jgi:Mn2+/Fe2+ NRAMP family transporter
VTVLWAVVAGAALKLVLNEGLARWQLATGSTFLEGAGHVFGWPARVLFFVYLVPWSFFVGAALMGACGVTLHAIVPVFEDAVHAKVAFGVVSSVLGLALARWGGFRLFEKAMTACIGVMFVTVVVTAALSAPSWSAVLVGLVVPRVPDAGGEGVGLTVALIGGVGGTLTVLCYGYWIREEGREAPEDLRACRVDLAAGYGMTALFGAAMVVIGSTVEVSGSGAGLVVGLGRALEASLGATVGPVARWLFLLGALGAVFSSLLGVWQAVPYLFADTWRSWRGDGAGRVPAAGELEATRAYRGYQLALAMVPMLGLLVSFKRMQVAYAVVGASFMPLLAVALLVMNGRRRHVGDLRHGWLVSSVLVATVLFFAWFGWLEVAR